MCLYIEDDETTPLSEGSRTARKQHECDECQRKVEPGETYSFWAVVDHWSERARTWKMCAHCKATIDLGCAFTGCPPGWFWGVVHDLEAEDSFVADILTHELTKVQRLSMLRTVAGRRKGWRCKDGALMRVPPVPSPKASTP